MLDAVSNSFDLNAYIKEYVTHKLFEVAYIGLKNALKRINKNKTIVKLEKFERDECIEYISQHIAENIRWATNISFRDAAKSKSLTDIFVEMNLYITPLKLRLDSSERVSTIPISELLIDTEKNIILLGQPGAGKTTSVKKIFLELIFRERELYEVFSFPLVIRLKDLSYNKEDNGLILLKEILNTLGIFYSFDGNVDELTKEKILIHIFKDFIERLDVLIILDGYDEIADKQLRAEIIRNLRLITNSLMNSKYILTSRSADYDLHIENTSEYEICPLTEVQISDFIEKWINNSTRSAFLLSQLKKSPYWDTTMRPLTLAHLCALYERNNSIPEKPKSVYKKIIQILLEDWSNQRSVERKSRYAKFEVDRKMDFLSRFAYELTVEYNRISFNRNILGIIYSSICSDFGLPKDESIFVVNEIESHNGLILQTGSDNFEFAHKSLLEYLVADYLVKLPLLIRKPSILVKIPNELAIWIAVSSNPSITYFELIHNILKDHCVKIPFLLSFLSRLINEKPDFETNPFLSLSHIYLLNLIIGKVYEIDEELPFAFDDDNGDDAGDDVKDDAHDDSNDDDKIRSNWDYINEDEVKQAKDGGEEHFTVSQLRYQKSYLLECAEILLSFKDDREFIASLKEVKRYYRIGEIELKSSSRRVGFKTWGKTFHLKRLRNFLISQSVDVELPDNLILTEVYKKAID